MNTQKIIVNVKGIPSPKSFPTQEELDALPTKKVRNVEKGEIVEQEVLDFDKMPRETVGNVILNVLNSHTNRTKLDGFYCNAIGAIVLGADTEHPDVELKEKFKTFLATALDDATNRVDIVKDEDGKDKEVKKGIYFGWTIAQVKAEIGITPDLE